MLHVDFNPFPNLETERLVLRRINSDDAKAILAIRSDDRVMQFIGRPKLNTIDEAKDLIEKIELSLLQQEGISWCITKKQNHTLIGTIGFWRLLKEHYRAEIGYLLHPDFQGQGIMHEAFAPVLKYGFEKMHLHSVEANVYPANFSSIKVLEKNGFIKEGYYKENYFFDGEFTDTAVYSLVMDNTEQVVKQ